MEVCLTLFPADNDKAASSPFLFLSLLLPEALTKVAVAPRGFEEEEYLLEQMADLRRLVKSCLLRDYFWLSPLRFWEALSKSLGLTARICF
jgi:hypothetical protein